MWDDRRAIRTLAKRWLALTEEITATTTERGRRARSARRTRPARATGRPKRRHRQATHRRGR